jgi:minor histocompatibility antigen H13
MADEPQMYIALVFMIACSIACIFVGSHRLLKDVRKGRVDEVLQAADAAAFPITGSCVLFGLYVALKFIPKSVIGMILSGYLSIAAVFALGGALRMVTGPRFLTGVVSVATCIAYLYTKHWILNNIMAISICITAISALNISNFKTSSILLIGLFIYDIFWVFGTDVMVSVATGIDGPIKILFPQTIFGSHDKKSLLGLGDIVIPGFFIAQTLVFSSLYVKRGTFYFRVAMWAYFLSLVNTMGVMLIFQHAQPALLYIVPWLLMSTLLAAAVKGDLKELFLYDVELTMEKQPITKPKVSTVTEAAKDEDGLSAVLWHLTKELFGFVADEDAVEKQPALPESPKQHKQQELQQKKKVAAAVLPAKQVASQPKKKQ